MPSRSIRYAKTVDGFHIAYEVVGDGPFDLVYVPGWFSNLECVWEMPDLGDFLRELASFSRLIVFDRRGSGLSNRPFTTDLLSLEVGLDDIRAVMDDAGSERAVLFGWEDGGCRAPCSPRRTPNVPRLSPCSPCGRSTTRRPITRGAGRRTRVKSGRNSSTATGVPSISGGLIAPCSHQRCDRTPSAWKPGRDMHVSRRVQHRQWRSRR